MLMTLLLSICHPRSLIQPGTPFYDFVNQSLLHIMMMTMMAMMIMIMMATLTKLYWSILSSQVWDSGLRSFDQYEEQMNTNHDDSDVDNTKDDNDDNDDDGDDVLIDTFCCPQVFTRWVGACITCCTAARTTKSGFPSKSTLLLKTNHLMRIWWESLSPGYYKT